MNDVIRAAILAFVQSLFPVLQILHVVSFTGDEVATIMLFVGNFLTLVFLIVKVGQQASGSSSTVTASVTTSPDPPR